MTIENTTDSGVFDSEFNEDSAADAFMNQWTDGESPSDEGESASEPVEKEEEDEPDQSDDEQDESADDDEEESEDDDQTSEEDSEDQSEDESEDESDDEPEETDTKEDLEVEVKVGDEVKKVKVKDLKRLYGQEAALTQKSQQIAAQRKAVEANAAKQAVVLDKLYQKAAERWEQYSKLDMLVLSKDPNIDAETFTKIRQEAQEAYEEFAFVQQEADAFYQHTQEMQKQQVAEKAAEAVKVLGDPVKGIKGWSTELYDKIRTYAVKQGLPQDAVDRIVDPEAIKMINKARLYDAMVQAKGKTKKVNKAPTNVIKPSNPQPKELKADKSKSAMRKLQQSGGTDDAMAAFMAKWAD